MTPSSPDKMLRMAVVGCGQIADLHISEVQKLPDVRLVGVCDTNAIMAEQAAVRFGIGRFYTDLNALIEEQRPDVVHITTPPASHLPLSKMVLERGAHVYLEKPFTINAAEAEEVMACAERAGRQVCAGHNFSFDPVALEAKQLLASGGLGELRHVDVVFSYNLKGAFGKILFEKPQHWIHRLPGKLFQNVIPHAVYAATDFLPDASPEIRAVGFKSRQERFGDVRDDFNDELRVFMKGERVTANITFSSQVRPMMHLARLYGTQASVHLDFHTRTVSFEHVSSLPGALGRVEAPFTIARERRRQAWRNVARFARSDLQFNAGMSRLFSAFYQNIREGKPSPIPMPEAVRVTRVMDEIFRQAQP